MILRPLLLVTQASTEGLSLLTLRHASKALISEINEVLFSLKTADFSPTFTAVKRGQIARRLGVTTQQLNQQFPKLKRTQLKQSLCKVQGFGLNSLGCNVQGYSFS